MLSALPLPKGKRGPRGPNTALHEAAFEGSTERTLALLARGTCDIDQGNPAGCTPLMFAASNGFSRVVRILLNKGADVLIVDDRAYTALHVAAERGHLAASKLLQKAGSDLEAPTTEGFTPLHLAAHDGHTEVAIMLIEAGANPNSRWLYGITPLYVAAQNGHLDVVRALLGAKADQRLVRTHLETGVTHVPVDMAAKNGHPEVVRELLQQGGVEGCGSARKGVDALVLASMNQHVDIMAMLTDAGVVDTGTALLIAADHGRESSAKFLLQQREGERARREAYVNAADDFGRTPLISGVMGWRSGSRSLRVLRMLVDAGADTESTVRVVNNGGKVLFNNTPLGIATGLIGGRKKNRAGAAGGHQMHGLEAIRHLLLRVEAVHALSWLWPRDNPHVACAAESTGIRKTASTPLRAMLPLLRRTANRQSVLRVALFRYSGKIQI